MRKLIERVLGPDSSNRARQMHLAMVKKVLACRRHSLKNAWVVVMYARPSVGVGAAKADAESRITDGAVSPDG